jgi:diguanylate cyclase (GGDEF)-like protein
MQRDDMTMTRRDSLNGGASPVHMTLAVPPPEAAPVAPDHHHQLQQHLAEAHTELRQLRSLLEKARQAERAARYLANHDGLTALPNRRAFAEHLSQALLRSVALDTDLAVLFIDLDHFKLINDTHGHRVGDQLLAIVGSRMAKAVRAADVAARLGGDEFACLLLHAPSVAHIAQVATKLFDSIAAPIQLGSLSLQVSASIGIAVRRRGETVNAEQLMSCADRAMYQAKKQQCRFRFARQCAGAAG